MYKTTLEELFRSKCLSFFCSSVSEKDHHGCHLQYSLKDQKINIGHTDTEIPKIYRETDLRHLQRDTRTINEAKAFPNLCGWTQISPLCIR